MKTALLPLSLCLLFAIAAPLCGEEALRLSLEDCETRSLSANRSLQAAGLNRDAARAAADAAYTAYVPSVTLSGGYSRTSPQDEFSITIPMSPPLVIAPNIEDSFFVRVEVRQNVFTGFKIMSAISLAEARYRVQEASFETERGNAVFNVRATYLGLAQALDADRITQKSLERIRSRLAEVDTMRRQGLATRNDQLKAELAVSQAEFEAADAAANVKLMRARLNLLIGLPLDTNVIPDTVPPLEPGLRNQASLNLALETAAVHRRELKSADGMVAAGEAGVSAAAAGLYPAVIIKGNFTYANPNPAVFPPTAEWRDSWEIGAVVSVDLGAYPQTMLRMEEARRRLDAARTGYAAVRESIALEVMAARLDVERTDGRLRTAEKMFAQAEENKRVNEQKFKNGQAVLSDVLDAEIGLLRAELAASQARLAARMARLTFLHKQGLSWRTSTP